MRHPYIFSFIIVGKYVFLSFILQIQTQDIQLLFNVLTAVKYEENHTKIILPLTLSTLLQLFILKLINKNESPTDFLPKYGFIFNTFPKYFIAHIYYKPNYILIFSANLARIILVVWTLELNLCKKTVFAIW